MAYSVCVVRACVRALPGTRYFVQFKTDRVLCVLIGTSRRDWRRVCRLHEDPLMHEVYEHTQGSQADGGDRHRTGRPEPALRGMQTC